MSVRGTISGLIRFGDGSVNVILAAELRFDLPRRFQDSEGLQIAGWPLGKSLAKLRSQDLLGTWWRRPATYCIARQAGARDLEAGWPRRDEPTSWLASSHTLRPFGDARPLLRRGKGE